MKIETVPFTVTHWDALPEEASPGDGGVGYAKTFQAGELRVRMVRYSAGYLADHWCDRGHVLLVLEGALDLELEDGAVHALGPGMSAQMSSGDVAHRVRTEDGATVFIVD